ncbi:L-xylulose reductase-like [Pomacea canaliculata]|uniref:L-xylulose reductase-like n=1 Tax=Pomacea canaliculata TaxID=400727 RepID=UPI000D73B7F0|nr:L-xylulose reductase-like [Pomacea canaliculata]
MEIRFDGKRALVTGAGKGIGRDIAVALHKYGAETVAISRSQEDLDLLKSECPGIQTVNLDLAEWSNVKTVVGGLGYFDLLVNSAGVTRVGPFLDVSEDDIDYVFNVNYKCLFNVCQTVAKGMVERGQGGAIVNISSVASTIGLADHAVYCSTKGAVDSLTQVMALELGVKKIRVNCVNPTVVMTDMGRKVWSDPAKANPVLARIPLGHFAEIEDVRNAVMFLLSEKASMINGSCMPIEGGLLCN